MNKKPKSPSSKKKEPIFRFRCKKNLLDRADAVAKKRGAKRAQIGREACLRFLEEEENRLGISGAVRAA